MVFRARARDSRASPGDCERSPWMWSTTFRKCRASPRRSRAISAKVPRQSPGYPRIWARLARHSARLTRDMARIRRDTDGTHRDGRGVTRVFRGLTRDRRRFARDAWRLARGGPGVVVERPGLVRESRRMERETIGSGAARRALRREFSPDSFSFVWRYHALLRLMRKRGAAVCRLLLGTAPVPQSSSFARARGDRQDPPSSWAAPSRPCCSSTPADRMRPATTTHSVLPSVRLTTSAPRSVTFRGSITQPVRSLSTRRGSDDSDHTTQDSLPAGGQPWRGRT
jgi:hypothetical protein